MFQSGFPPIIRSTKLHIQRQAFVKPLLLTAASLDGMGLTEINKSKKGCILLVVP